MSRYCGDKNSEPILQAADHWQQRALVRDGSVFSDETLWRVEHLEALERHVVNQPDVGKGTFFEKLQGQLAPTEPEAKQLAAEMLWVMFLCPSNVTAATKREGVRRVWSWSEQILPENSNLLSDEVLGGIGSAGTSYNTNRWRELAFFIRVMLAFKRASAPECEQLLSDGWALAGWLGNIPQANSRQLRPMILFLLFPDHFERIFGGTHRKEIVRAFTNRSRSQVKAMSALEIDRELHEIRAQQERTQGTAELDFYVPPLRELWSVNGFHQFTGDIAREHILHALEEIDDSGIPGDAHSTTYDLIYGERRYPPKLVLSLASKYATGEEFDRSLFSGGEKSEAFRLLRSFGFHIERKDFVETLVSRFIEQADAAQDLSTSEHPKSYRGLKVVVSFGKGNFAKVPWISFAGYGQKTKRGIYPVFLYYKSVGALLLCHGISEETPPETTWGDLPGKQKVGAFLPEHYGASPERYGDSYVFAAYKVADRLVWEEVTRDLDKIVKEYEETMEGTQPDEPEHWIFQGNPKIFDVRGYVSNHKEIVWSVNQSKHQIKAGQTGYLWQAGPDGGVIAMGTVLTDPQIMKQNPNAEPYVRDREAFPEEHPRVRLQIDAVLSEPIDRNELMQHPILKNLTILKFANATNFMISNEQYNALNELVRRRTEYVATDRERITGRIAEPPPEPYSIDQALEDLFIAPDKFRGIVELFRAKKNIILQGPPGVGKTFFSKRLAYALMGEKDPDRLGMVQFHQSYSYEDFIQGYRPSGTGFVLKDGVFYQFCRKAMQDPGRKYVFVIDEINRSNLSKVFGELMMLIEPDKRGPEWAMPLAYGSGPDEKFYVPENLYLLGLMNTADRSLAMVDYALRRRFGFMDLLPGFDTPAFRDHLAQQGVGKELVGRIVMKMGTVNDRIAKDTSNLGPGYCIGHSFFCSVPSETKPDEDWYRRVVRTEIEPLLKEYWFDDLSQAESLVRDVLLAD